MKQRRVSLPMVFAIVVMFIAWLALEFAGKEGRTNWLLIGIVRMLLVVGMAVCVLAAGIAYCFGLRQAPPEKPKAGAGVVAAVLLGLLASGVAGLGVWDAACGGGGSGEWVGFGDLVVFAFALTGGTVSLLLALCLKSMPQLLRVPCIVLAALALGLPFAIGPLRKARGKKHYEEMMNSEKMRRVIEEAKEGK
jgi:hypothetical protein